MFKPNSGGVACAAMRIQPWYYLFAVYLLAFRNEVAIIHSAVTFDTNGFPKCPGRRNAHVKLVLCTVLLKDSADCGIAPLKRFCLSACFHLLSGACYEAYLDIACHSMLWDS